MIEKYSDLNLTFRIEYINFTVLNLAYERFLRSIPSHSHSGNSYEIHYVPYGYGSASINGTLYQVTPNTLYVTGPHIEHAQEPNPADPMVEYCIYIKIESNKNKGIMKNSIITPFKDTTFWFGQDTQNMLSLMQQLFWEMRNQVTGYQIQVETLLKQCIIKLLRNYEAASYTSQNSMIHPTSSAAPLLPGESGNLFERKYLILEESFLYEYQDITLQKLSTRLGLGIRQTERLLKEQYGKTFLQKKTEARMSAAIVLLKDSSKNLSKISSELGYSSLEHFSTAFRHYYGTSARDYRKNM